MVKKLPILVLGFLGIFLPVSLAFAANITGDYKYAWSNNAGYINFENVTVADSALTGYAWSKNSGWIRLDPPNGGVANNNGDLSGYAWGEHLGWINFNNVSINTSNGKFSGTATGDLIGTLTFDCPTYCDVRTDWRPATQQTDENSSSSSNSTNSTTSTSPTTTIESNNQTKPILIYTENKQFESDPIGQFFKDLQKNEPEIRKDENHRESYNAPLTVEPGQNGLLVWDFSTPEMMKESKKEAIIIELPYDISSDTITISVKLTKANLPVKDTDNQIEVLGAVFDVTAVNEKGKEVNYFHKPIKTTLIIPEDLRGRNNLGVYYLADNADDWKKIDNVVFDERSAIFYIDHLTKFAIFSAENFPENIQIDSSGFLYWFIVVVLIILLALFLLFRRKINNI